MKKQKLEKKENVWVEEVRRRNVAAIERNADLVLKVRDSGIDFSKFGWVGQVAKLLNKQPQKVNVWMKRYAQDIYENAFKRK
jgi:selenophosphate synthetase-related protein